MVDRLVGGQMASAYDAPVLGVWHVRSPIRLVLGVRQLTKHKVRINVTWGFVIDERELVGEPKCRTLSSPTNL